MPPKTKQAVADVPVVMEFGGRKKYKYHCVITHAETGQVVEQDFITFWSSAKTELSDVANACAAQHSVASKQKHLPVSAELVSS